MTKMLIVNMNHQDEAFYKGPKQEGFEKVFTSRKIFLFVTFVTIRINI